MAAPLLDAQQMMWTEFQPKTQNRYILFVDGLPAWLIKAAARPSYAAAEITLDHMNVQRYIAGKGTWQATSMTLYDPIVPSAAQATMEWVRLQHESVTGRDGYSDFYKKDITVNVFGPPGDIVEEWTLKGAFVTSADFGALDWSAGEAVMEVALGIRYDYAILQF